MPMHLSVDSLCLEVGKGEELPCGLLKVVETDSLAFVDVDLAARASAAAALAGLSPRLEAHDSEDSAFFYEWLDTRTWRMAMREDLERAGLREAVIRALQRWHESPRLGRERPAFDTVRARLRCMESSSAEGRPPAARPVMPMELCTIVDWLARIEAALLAAGADIAPVHGDNSLSNVMIDAGDRVRLVGWNHAADDDPHADLAGFCLEYAGFAEDVSEAVEIYAGRVDARIAARVRLHMIVQDALWGCWALALHVTSPRKERIEFYKYGRNRLLRARYWIDRWDLAALLRRI